MKRAYMLFFCLALALACGGCAHDKGIDAEEKELIVVGFSQVGAESDWRNANTNSMQAALSEENGCRLIFDDAQQKQERQITAIRNFIQQEVDYIVLAPTRETGWDTILAEAKAVGIPVIVVDRMIEVADESLFTCWVGSDFHKEGRTAVEWMDKEFGEKPVRIVHLQGNIGSSAQIGRTSELDRALQAHPDWILVARESCDFTQAKGQEYMEELLKTTTEFDVVYAENDNMAYGAMNALRDAGLRPGKDVTILSFDANKAALELTLKGEISFNVECNPLHGPRVWAIIEQLEAGGSPPKLTFVEETSFDARTVTREVIDARAY